MAPTTRSGSVATPEADTGSSAAAAAETMTISRADFEAMQAQIASSCQLTTETPDTVIPTNSVASTNTPVAPTNTTIPTNTVVPIKATAQSSLSAPGPALVVTAYRGKGPKPNIYYGGSRGKYNIFIRQCESNFILKGNNHDSGRVAYGAAYLEGTPANVWDSHKKYHTNPNAITWVEFKLTVYVKLGDVANIQRNLTEQWYRAQQGHDETIQAYAARLDQLAEDIGRRLADSERSKKFRVGLRYTIKAKMDKQASQATTHCELVA